MILRWFTRRHERRAMAEASHGADMAARVLDDMAAGCAAHAAKLPHGPARDMARMQQYAYSARADAYRAEAGGDLEGAEAHRADAAYWQNKIEAAIGKPERTADIVHLDVARMREAGL